MTPLVVRVLPDVPAIDKTFDYLVPDALRDQVRVGDVVRDRAARPAGRRLDRRGRRRSARRGSTLRPLAKRSGRRARRPTSSSWPSGPRGAGPAGRRRSCKTASPERVVRQLPAPAPATVAARRPTTRCSRRRSPARGRCCGCRPPPTSCTWRRPAPPSATRWCCARRWRMATTIAARLRRTGVRGGHPPARLGRRRGRGDRRGHAGRGVGAGGATWRRWWCSTSTTRPTSRSRRRRGTRATSPSSGPGGRACRACSPARARRWRRWPGATCTRPTGRATGPAGRRSRWSTGATRTRGGPGCSPTRWCGCSGRTAACCACSTARAGRSCSPARRAASWRAARAATRRCEQPEAELRCPRCDATRPPVCLVCGAGRFKNARAGVTRVREELEALVGEPVTELTATSDPAHPLSRVVVGTEAVLQRIDRADAVAFLDLDQELLAPRYRAVEQALALVARAARVVAASGPVDGARRGAPAPPDPVARPRGGAGRRPRRRRRRWRRPSGPAASCSGSRRAARWPRCPGAAAPAFVDAPGRARRASRWRRWRPGAGCCARADHPTLCDALAAVRRPPGRLRVEVDPLRV